ncbi:MAG: phosphoglucosamine mutase [Ilumatobacter sp.]|nr:phosphoglucosamine mutase [Ilumatobacter sp.]MBT5276481.1 phosphoglucosamine mutase [Ilumatobacter sp.]MBT5554941.1 phosphoglucosamine mutase [Ilumatobacter sp.]MBT5865482.1 phosphoglucosamine mutase [Ilumatobacter sp.]MBT7428816.1 phosphoglucosamine mutase [Ilumatobacter sp.]
MGTMKFGTDGVRGVANTELTAGFALNLGRAAAQVLSRLDTSSSVASEPVDVVVIGGDTRESTPMLRAALGAGFAAEGVDVIDLGTATTPMVAFEAQRLGVMGAVVSASHNPYGDNGIKLFAPGGTKLTDDVEARIESVLESLGDPTGSAGRLGTHDDAGPYSAHVLAFLDGRDLAGIKVVLDAANGAGCSIAPDVLRAAGADVVVIAADPDGRNINDGCGATHPELVAAAVVQHGADLGVALDGDADRLIAVDGTGTVVDGDHIIAICAADLRGRGQLANDTVVVTVMTNLGFRLAMDVAGINVVETGVGDRYVLEALGAGGHSLGGEQSGHVIFADHATTGDGLLTAVALIDIVKRSERTLADIASDAMTSLPQSLVNVRVGERVPDVAERLADEIAVVEADLGATGRVLVRPSGTEPLIRVMVEAATPDQAQAAADQLAEVARTKFA